MRPDLANRSFLVFVAIALPAGAVVLWGALGAVLVPLILASRPRQGVPPLPVLAFLAPVALGLALGARSLGRQVLASRRLARGIRRLTVTSPGHLQRTASRAGLRGRVVLVDAAEPFSFVYGALTPRVVVSSGLLGGASREELRAVLEHERYHVRNLDPLKLLLLRALSGTLFFLPVLGLLRARYLTGRELAADRHAVATCGRRPLVGALLKVVRAPAWSELDVTAPLDGHQLLDARVAQIETGREPGLGTPSPVRVVASLLGAAALTVAYLASVSSFGPTALHHLTRAGLADATVRGGFACGAPLAGAALALFSLIALRARRPLRRGAR